MSMNLHLRAARDVVVVKTGKHSTQNINFDLYQTSTKTTKAILDSCNIIQAYTAYVESLSSIEEEDVFGEDDTFGEDEPIGKKVVDHGKEHILNMLNFIKDAKEEGYEIKFFGL
jgi:hypothetical protein